MDGVVGGNVTVGVRAWDMVAGRGLLPQESLSEEERVSPVTLYEGWSRVARLLLLATMAVVGSIGNVFMISACMIEHQLNKRGLYVVTPIYSFKLQ